MIEVGTTNRTRLDDYEKALSDRTHLVMRVHPSNYRIVGFTASPSLAELASFAHDNEVPLYEDAGSGVLFDLSKYGLGDEPVVSQSLAEGADLVSFSGDKLLGACQAGLIVGKSKFVARLRRHPLYRALRADKLTLGVLEKTLESYSLERAAQDVPVLRMLALSRSEIEGRARKVIETCHEANPHGPLELEIQDGESAIGGGAGPNTHPATALLSVRHALHSADQIETALRLAETPIITRIAEGRVLIDLRTVECSDDSEIASALSDLLSKISVD